MDENVTILMTSCQAYSDILYIHDQLFQKYWHDCPFKKILVVDKYDQKVLGESFYDEVIEAGDDAEGDCNGVRIVQGLRHIKTPYLILLQEDFLLYDHVDTALILNLVKLAKKYHAGNIRFTVDPITEDQFSVKENLLEYKRGMAYRLSMQAGLWKTKYLYKMFSKCKNGSEFERKGSFESVKYEEPILAWGGVAYPYMNAIQKGKWLPHCVNIVQWNKLAPDFRRHSVMTNKDRFLNELKGYILSINPQAVVKIQNLLNFGKKY